MQRWHSILLLCLVSLTIRTATCQEAGAAAAEPSAALDPAVAADLLPAEHLPADASAAGVAAALVPLSEAAKAQLVDSMMAGVQAGKDEVRQALANPAAAFEQYTAQWASGAFKVASVPAPGSAADKKTLAQRQRIFLSNLKRYNRLNAQDPAMAHGITPFSHLTEAEFKATMLPFDMTPTDTAQGTPAATLGRRLKACGDYVSNPYASGTPPAGVNWVTANMLPAIRNQGQCGSCAAFATTGIAEFAYIKKNGANPAQVDLSEQELLDCTPGNGCSGAYLDTYIRKIGCSGGMLTEAQDTYNVSDIDACPALAYTPVGIANWAYVANNANSLALAVANAATLIGVDANNWSSYTSGYMGTNCPVSNTLNHAVVAVGYVNGVTVSNKKYDFWLVRNSWGTGWGGSNAAPYKGYVWVRKDCRNSGAYSIYRANPIVPIVG